MCINDRIRSSSWASPLAIDSMKHPGAAEPSPGGEHCSSEPLPLLKARGISKLFPECSLLTMSILSFAQGKLRVAGRKRRGQKHAHAHPCRRLPTRRGHGPPAGKTCPVHGREDGAKGRHRHGLQERSLAPTLSVAENIFFGRQPGRGGIIDQKKLHQESRRILDELGTDIEPTALVENLPPASQQMVEIAKALSLNAAVLVLDEPTSALTETETTALSRPWAASGGARRGRDYLRTGWPRSSDCDRMTGVADGERQGIFLAAKSPRMN